MCAVNDADESVHLLSDEARKARKVHKCVECYRDIHPTEVYRYESGTLDGQFVIYKTCAHCMVVRDWLWKECGGWLYQGVAEDIFDHAFQYQQIGLYRLTVGMRRRWRRFDGAGLMDIPGATAEKEQAQG